jgi:hypothetical protein
VWGAAIASSAHPGNLGNLGNLGNRHRHRLGRHHLHLRRPTWPMRSPMLCGAVKSKGVPATGWMTPVGMRVGLTGVKWSAVRRTTWSRMSPLAWPARLK